MRDLLVVSTLLSSLLLVCPCHSSQIPLLQHGDHSSPFSSRFEKYINHKLDEWHVPGLAIAVISDTQTWSQGFGYADLETKVPVTPHTLFEGASTTKSFTASLAALLVQDNTTYKGINWDAKLHELTPYHFVLEDQYESAKVTLIDALSHRTGMPRHDYTWINTNATITDRVKTYRYLTRSAPFRTTWQYCNLMYTAVAHAIQVVTSKPIGDVYQELLFSPLDMNETFTDMHDSAACAEANPLCTWSKNYNWRNSSNAFEEIPLSAIPPIDGAGGVISNVNDYAKWVRALMTASGPVSKEGHGMLRYPHIVAKPNLQPFTGPAWYGLGLMGAIYRGHQVYLHNGASGGYFSQITFIPSLGWGAVVFQNAPGPLQQIISLQLLDDFLGVPEADRTDMNHQYRVNWNKQRDAILESPSTLFPDLDHPLMAPALKVTAYEGVYSHPAYGNVTLSTSPSKRLPSRDWLKRDDATGIKLYSETALFAGGIVLHHVTREHWLVQVQLGHVPDIDIPSEFAKARTEVGSDGNIESIYMTPEATLKGDSAWIKFDKVV